jgi:drug/metabolite transporter (DMT)-like permease
MPSAPLTVALTAVTLIAFAANALLARLALEGPAIDPASYTTLRLASGALVLWLIVTLSKRPRAPAPVSESVRRGRWLSASMLFLYAITFSVAYLTVEAGTGALILFGAVQVTMIGAGILAGHRPNVLEWTGLVVAFVGLVYLVSPGLTAPDPVGAGLMAVAGLAWGVYSLRGRGSSDPVGDTAANFIRAVPFAVAASLIAVAWLDITARGVWLALASGVVASGLGYVIWYAALRGLTATRAAIVQLAVPVIAAAGGVLLLAEPLTWRLTLASVIVLGGVALAIVGKGRARA